MSKEAFEKIIERLEEKWKEPLYQHEGEDYFVGISEAFEIVNQVAGEYNKDWIPVSDRLPEIEEYYNPFWVTILTKDSRGKDFYYTRKATWNQYNKRWEEGCGKPVSDKINIIAWKEYKIPAPYQPKG